MSTDKKAEVLQKAIENYLNKIIDRLNNYYSLIYKQVHKDVNNALYNDLLIYVENFDKTIYVNLVKRISKDKNLKLEASDFGSKSFISDLFNYIAKLYDKYFERRNKRNKQIENNLFNRTSEMDNIYNEFKDKPDTSQNLYDLRTRVLKAAPAIIDNILDEMKKMIENLKVEAANTEKLKQIL